MYALRRCLFMKGSSKCSELDQVKRTHLLVSDLELLCVTRYGDARAPLDVRPASVCVCLCVRPARRSRLHASERSERLAAESQELRRQEIKHEMKTSSSLNILPSHFPISPLPLADLKREEGLAAGATGVGEKKAELKQRRGSSEQRLS